MFRVIFLSDPRWINFFVIYSRENICSFYMKFKSKRLRLVLNVSFLVIPVIIKIGRNSEN